MGKRAAARRASPMWVTTEDLPASDGHPFFERLNRVLDESGFDAFVEGLCSSFYADRSGRPSLQPRRYVQANYSCRLASTISTGSVSSWIEINNNNVDPVGGVGGAERRPKWGGKRAGSTEHAGTASGRVSMPLAPSTGCPDRGRTPRSPRRPSGGSGQPRTGSPTTGCWCRRRFPTRPVRAVAGHAELHGRNASARMRWILTIRVDPIGAGLFLQPKHRRGRRRWMGPRSAGTESVRGFRPRVKPQRTGQNRPIVDGSRPAIELTRVAGARHTPTGSVGLHPTAS